MFFVKHIIGAHSKKMNIVEATKFIRFLSHFLGLGFKNIHVLPFNDVKTSFSWLGIVTSILGILAFGWSTYCVNAYRQTLILTVFESKLKFYGEYFESLISTIVVVSCWSQLLFVNQDSFYWKYMLSFDDDLRKLRAFSICKKLKLQMFVVASAWIGIIIYEFLSLYIRAVFWLAEVPIAKLFHIMYTFNVFNFGLICFYFNAFILETRYFYLNEVLRGIAESSNNNESFNILLVKEAKSKPGRNRRFHSSAETINSVSQLCSKIYGLRVKADQHLGRIVASIIFLAFFTMILRIFYIIEATAGGLYKDFKTYSFFFFSNSEYIVFAMASVIAIIHACERVYGESSKTAGIIHNIIQQQTNEEIIKQATLLSAQLIHQQHKFSANGLFNLETGLLLSVTGSVTTYITILLQFATSAGGGAGGGAGASSSYVRGANLTHHVP